MSGIGHNHGPSMEGGRAWRKHCWTKARADLLPTLPIEVLRLRVARAKALHLPYKTYASVRASTGRDVVGFLFSSNALRVLRPGQAVPPDRAEILDHIAQAKLTCLAHPPLRPESLAKVLPDFATIAAAPNPHRAWSQTRTAVQAPLITAKLPLDGVLVIGDTRFEQDWSEAGRLAGFLPSDAYFAPLP